MARKPKPRANTLLTPNGVHLYIQYVKRAKKKGMLFKLSKIQFYKLTQRPCYICGSEPSQSYVHSYKRPSLARSPFVYNGIDRVNNKRGYVRGNVMSCCKTCNHAKMEQSLHDYLQYVYRCYSIAIRPYLPTEATSHEGIEEDDRTSEDTVA